MSSEVDPFSELAALVRESRTALEWHQACGSDGMASEVPTRELFGPLRRPASPPPAHEVGAVEVARTPEARPVWQPPARPPAAELRAPAAVRVTAQPASLTVEERHSRLSVLAEKVAGCTLCALSASRTQTVFARGNPAAELMFVGEGPGADEDLQGKPFVGKAGQLLDKMIVAMGLTESDVYICNIVKCRPPDNRVPLPVEMAACMPYLNAQLDVVGPKVIVALGSTALKGLLGPGEGITKARGAWKIYRGAIPLMPTFHPAYVLRQPTREVKAMVWSDLQQVLKELGRSLPKRGS